MSLAGAVACIRRHRRFVITSHTNMEGDALGSQLAFYRLLRKLGKRATIVNEDAVPYGYEFLPGRVPLQRYSSRLRLPDFDCLVALDCSDLRRTGEVWRLNAAGRPVLNIDHHISNEYFGTVNWVEPHASSACEMVYRLFGRLGVAPDRQSALCLYVGMMTDTGSFRYANTSAATLAIAAKLVARGLRVDRIYQRIYANIPYEGLQLLTEVLPTMRRTPDGRILWFSVARSRVKKYRAAAIDLGEHVLTFGRSLRGVEVVLLFKENMTRHREIRVNFRSQGAVDVRRIAARFGGGGHRAASGCTVSGSLEAVRQQVLRAVKKAVYARGG